MGRALFGMPWTIAFAFGFCIGAVSPAVLVPSLMILHRKGFGVTKGIPTTLIAASSFDDIIAITVFGVMTSVAFEIVGEFESKPVGQLIGKNLLDITVGLAAGLILGYILKVFNYMKCISEKVKLWIKFAIMVVVAIFAPIVSHVAHLHEAKYVFIIFFGYMCNQQWKVPSEDLEPYRKPEHQMSIFWKFCEPILFGTVGASIKIREISGGLVGQGLGILALGLLGRWTSTYLAGTFEKGKYTRKEKAFMAFSWIPKATV
jgi:NhaP-type Na+/H+ or K+/H+ antiporter